MLEGSAVVRRAGAKAAAALLCWPVLAWAAAAHHSFAGKYDGSRAVTFSGTVTSLDYRNPHIVFHIEAANGGSWTVEAESIPKVEAKGLTRAHIAPGARVTVTGWPARDGSAQLGLKSITVRGGRAIQMRIMAR